MTAGRQDGVSNVFSGEGGNIVQAGTVHGGIHVHKDDRPMFPPPRQLPLGVSGFINREADIRKLDDLLNVRSDEMPERPRSVVISAIAGAPGIGKTALAVHWAHRVRRHFPDGDLYVDMHGYDSKTALSPTMALDAFLRALAVSPDRVPDDLEQRAALYRSMLDGKRILILIDNVSSVADIRQLLPASNQCLALVTSRSRLSGLVVREGAARVTLDVLSPDESVRLLREVIGDGRVDVEPEAARQVAGMCGYLPLALRVVAERAAARPGLTLTQLVEELVGEQSRLDALTAQEDELTDVRAVFSWSYQALMPELRRVFRLLGLHAGPELGSRAAAALIGADPATARRRLQALAGVHLIQEISTDRYRLHDLMRSYAIERAFAEDTQEDRTKAVRRSLTWYLLTTDVGRRVILPYSHAVPLLPAGDLPVIDAFGTADEAMRWFERERVNLVAALRQAMDLGQYDIGWKLPVVADGFFELRSYWADWKEIHELGLEAALMVGDMLGEASNLLGLGDADLRTGGYDTAAGHYQRIVDLSRQIGDVWLEGFALRGLGLVQEELTNLDDAYAHFLAALAVFQASGVRRGEGMTLLSLGKCARALGQPAEAVTRCQRAVEIFQELHDRWSEAWGLCPLALSLHDQGRFAEATDCLREAIGIFRDIDDNSQAMALVHLGDVLLASDDREGARGSWRQAADLYEALKDRRVVDAHARLMALAATDPDEGR